MCHALGSAAGDCVTLDQFLLELRERRLILISPDEVWPSPLFTDELRRALRQHRRELRQLVDLADIRTCASPTWHRKYWRYAGNGRYVCPVCEKIAVS